MACPPGMHPPCPRILERRRLVRRRNRAWLCLGSGLVLGCIVPKQNSDTSERLGIEPPGGQASIDLASSCRGSDPPRCNDESCCEARWVPGGTFPMGEAPASPGVAAPEGSEHDVTLSGFYLDRFEVNLARFAAFAADYSATPVAEGGAHPRLPGSGWQPIWNSELPATPELLWQAVHCGTPPVEYDPAFDRSGLATPEDAGALALDAGAAVPPIAAGNPMPCLSWFVAFAFCLWDGARLPTEAEWEYAAAGGALNQRYPWGDAVQDYLQYVTPGHLVGATGQAGPFGHFDLAGGVREWTLDWYDARYFLDEGRQCRDCANHLREAENGRSVRGDANRTEANPSVYRCAARNQEAPGVTLPNLGVRCARDAPQP